MLYNNLNYLINCVESYSFSITYSFCYNYSLFIYFFCLSYLLIDVIIT